VCINESETAAHKQTHIHESGDVAFFFCLLDVSAGEVEDSREE
jgi:ketosteroid isomerase-like protein